MERRVVDRGVGEDEQDVIGAATTMTLLIAAYGLDIVLLLLQCLRPTGSSHPSPLPVWQVVVAC